MLERKWFQILVNIFLLLNHFVYSLKVQHIKSNIQQQSSLDSDLFKLQWANDDELYDDESYGLLELNKPISQPQLLDVYSINNSKDNSPMIKFGQKRSKKQSLLSVENVIDLEGEDAWMTEARDAIEQRIGRAIWTGKSDQQIKAEYRKNQALKAMRMPETVRKLIEDVFIEKTIKMRDYPKKNKLAVIEYRKWLMEQKQKQANVKVKKSPLLAAKVEVSKRWLKRPQSMSAAADASSVKPAVVHDELTAPPSGYSVGANSKTTAMAAPNFFFSAAAPLSIITSSIVHWEKPRAEYLQTHQQQRGTSRFPSFGSSSSGGSSPASSAVESSSSASGSSSVTPLPSQHLHEAVAVDGEEMFIASNINKQDYFVLL